MRFLLGIALAAQPLQSATIDWQTPVTIAGPADVSTEGAYFGSWSPGNASPSATPINGVKFKGNDLEISTSGFTNSGPYFGTHTTVDENYNSLLHYGAWSNSTTASLTFNGTGRRPTTPGRRYLVQLWVSDTRDLGTLRSGTVSGSGTLNYPANGTGMGQYVIGRFTADAASQSLDLSATQTGGGGSAQVNLVLVRGITPPEAMTRCQRWKTLKYGIFSHYTYAVTGDVNTAADGFNAQAYADDVAQAGAQYVVWTAWHGNMFPMFPSKAAEKYGIGNRCSQRDTVSDMIDAVRAKGIRVFLYVHPYQPVSPINEIHNDYINELFAEVIDRYGPRIDGLWIDENQIYSDQDSLVDYKRLMETIKSGNPDLLTMQNGGQLYTADMGGPEVVNSWNFGWSECMYNYVNPGYGPGAEDMLRTTVLMAASNFEGGGVHWSVDGVANGGLLETSRLFQLGQSIAPIRASICDTQPSASFPPPYKDGRQVKLSEVKWVATASNDETKEFIYVLKAPTGNTLTLPATADGKVFGAATLMDSLQTNGGAQQHIGTPMTMVHSSRGTILTLPAGVSWSTLDTVIQLEVLSKGGAGMINDTSAAIIYTGGSWIYQGNCGSGEYNNDIHTATADGDSFTFTFTGTDVEIITTRAADRGTVDIFIDDVFQTTVDLSTGPAFGSRMTVYSKFGLARGRHTLKCVNTAGTRIDVDAFKVTKLINDSDPDVVGGFSSAYNLGTNAATYSGLWQPGYNGAAWITPGAAYIPDSSPLAGTMPGGDSFEFNFYGTHAQITLTSAYASGYFYLMVDGVFRTNIQTWPGNVQTFSTGILPLGNHTIKAIVWKAVNDPYQPGINGFTVTRPEIWQASSGRGYGEIGDDVHYTDLNPGAFSYAFHGSGVDVITTRDQDARMGWFGVSGGDVSIGARRNSYAATRQVGTSVFSIPNLKPGSYSVSAQHNANMSGLNFAFARLAIDALRVYKGESLSTTSFVWGAGGNGGSGTWDIGTTANWHDGGAATVWHDFGGNDYAAVFGGTAGSVNLVPGLKANHLTFNTTGYTLAGNSLTLSGVTPTITTQAAIAAIIATPLSSAPGLTKDGPGSHNVESLTSSPAAVTVAAGTLHLTGDNNNYWAVQNTVIGPGARLSNNTHSHILNLHLQGGELASTGVDAFWGGWMFDRDILVTGNTTSVISALRVAIANGTNVIRGFEVAAVATLDVTGSFEDAATTTGNGLKKTGEGVMRLLDTGPTTVSGGRLVINGSVNQSSSVTIAAAAEMEIFGSLATSGHLANSGTLRLLGDATFSSSSFINFGVLDLINWTGTLPAGFVNQGVVLDRSSLKITSSAISGNDFTLTIHGHAGHNFQLQRTADLTSPWLNIGPAQPGTGATLTFTDTAGAGPSTRFYRVAVSTP